MERAHSAEGVTSPSTLPERPPRTWASALVTLRSRLIANPKFQIWAARLPFVRHIARRKSLALFDLCAGFVYSQILTACVRLNVVETLADGPLPIAELARRFELEDEAAKTLMSAAASLGLVRQMRNGAYALDDLGSVLLGQPSIAAMVRHHALLYDDLRDPVALLRAAPVDTDLKRFWAYAGADASGALDDADVAEYSALMSSTQAMIAREVLNAYPVGRHRRLLDVGGGEGAFVAAVARRHGALELSLFDLPAVASRARRALAAQGLGNRVSVHGGDLFNDALPAGADLITLVRIIHDHDDAAAERILTAVFDALAPGGTLVIAEPMSKTREALSVSAYFSFYLWAMGSGRPRTAARLTEMLAAAGFSVIRPASTTQPMLVRVLTAQKP